MRQFLIDFLKAIESALPPPPKTHHAFTYAQYGSDEAGWSDRLALQLNVDGVFYCYFIEDGDFEMGIDPLVTEIAKQQAERSDNAQKGVAIGQYVTP